ncbi:MAG TPA: DUF2007 domain-containing protein [Gemmatimonadaceae bacterium]|jgi:hypothetical protein
MTSEPRFVLLASFANGFAADIARERLEADGIPVLLKGPQVGIFGGGFQGTTVGGVELFVPSPELDRAKDLLDN